MIQDLVQWQRQGSDGIVQPWFTHPCLDEIEKWDVKDKKILEFGAGRSTKWWRSRSKWVTSIEANPQWAMDVEHDCHGLDNGLVILKEINEGDQSRVNEYVNAGALWSPYDIIINDGILRTEVCEYAIKHFSTHKGILIADNWIQSFVWMSPLAEEIMKPFRYEVYEQSDHTDNDGVNKWKTAIFYFE